MYAIDLFCNSISCRVMEEGDFASEFHVYAMQWLPDLIRFYVDGILIGEVDPPAGGFWEIGGFDKDPGGENIWANGTTMTPFDRRVCFVIYNRFIYVYLLPPLTCNVNVE